MVHRDQGRVRPDIRTLSSQSQDVALEGYAHYMLKEIYEQPQSIKNALRGRLDKDNATAKFGGLNLTPQQLRSTQRIILTGLRYQLAFCAGRLVSVRRVGKNSG